MLELKMPHICNTPEYLAGGVTCHACRQEGVQDHICDQDCLDALQKLADESWANA